MLFSYIGIFLYFHSLPNREMSSNKRTIKFTKRKIIALAISAAILASILAPFPGAKAIEITVNAPSSPIDQGDPIQEDIKIEIAPNELIPPNSQIKIKIVDSSNTVVKEGTFDVVFGSQTDNDITLEFNPSQSQYAYSYGQQYLYTSTQYGSGPYGYGYGYSIAQGGGTFTYTYTIPSSITQNLDGDYKIVVEVNAQGLSPTDTFSGEASFTVNAPAPSGGGGAGGGALIGGGGGAGTVTIKFSQLLVGSGNNPTFDLTNIPFVNKITLQLKTAVGEFTLSTQAIERPTNLPDAPGDVMQYYRITVPSNVNTALDKGILTIAIPEDVIGNDNIKFYRYDEQSNKWIELPVKKVGVEDGNVVFEVELDHFSFFALVREKVTAPPEMPTAPFSETFSIEEFDVPVTLTDGRVESIDVNIDEKSLDLKLADVEEDAKLTITIPRGLLDSKNPDGTDTEFSVLIDGELVACEEDTVNDERVLTCEIPAMSEEINIIGTFVVPEFGIIAMMILAVSIAGVLVASRRYIKLH